MLTIDPPPHFTMLRTTDRDLKPAARAFVDFLTEEFAKDLALR